MNVYTSKITKNTVNRNAETNNVDQIYNNLMNTTAICIRL